MKISDRDLQLLAIRGDMSVLSYHTTIEELLRDLARELFDARLTITDSYPLMMDGEEVE